MKVKLIGAFNALVWCFVLWVFLCVIASIATWSNYFVVGFSDWDSPFRLIYAASSFALFYVCIKGSKK